MLVSSGNATDPVSQKGMTYSKALSSSSEELRCLNEAHGEVQKPAKVLTGEKRPRSPSNHSCGRCFRTIHKTAECRHQVVCLRYAGVGHVAANCRMELRRSPKRKLMHVRSKRSLDAVEISKSELLIAPARSPPRPRPVVPWRSSLSLPLISEITTVREELSKVAVLTLLSGYITDSALGEVLPSIINCSLAGSLTAVNDISYLVPLSSRAEVKEVCMLDVVTLATKDGRCTARIAPWSAEMGATDRAAGEGQ